MNSIKNLLNKNGFLYITTPDIKHWRRNKSLKDWDAYCPPAHCLFFSKKRDGTVLSGNKTRGDKELSLARISYNYNF